MSTQTSFRNEKRNHNHNGSHKTPFGWFIILVSVKYSLYKTYETSDPENLMFGKRYFEKKVGEKTETFTVYVTAQEMGRLKIGDRVSIKKGGFMGLGEKYYLRGNPKCSMFSGTTTGAVVRK